LDSPFDPLFSTKTYLESIKSCSSELSKILDLPTETPLSLLHDASKLQESFCFRKERRAKFIAAYLIQEEGHLESDRLDLLIHLLKEEGYITYPDGFSDCLWSKHTLSVAEQLKENPKIFSLIKRCKLPLYDTPTENLIRFSLGLFHKEPLTNTLLQQSLLSACFSLLRQNVGSCFATAPAILIQTKHLELFLEDLYELLYTGKLSRTFEGSELSVPLSPSTGGGDLYKKIPIMYADKSPGLFQALKAADLVRDEKDFIKILSLLILEKHPISVRDFFKKVLLSHFSLTDKDLISYEEIESSLVKTQGFGSSLTAHLPPAKIANARQFLEKQEIAEAAFKAVIDHPLVKAWEFTLASFSEVKSHFNQWNLYPSLGFHPEEKWGIGESIHSTLQKRLDNLNEKIEEYQNAYEAAFHEARSVETLLKRASTESEARRLQAEYSSRLHHMQSCEDLRDDAHSEAKACSSFFSLLTQEYIKYFPNYFQEIYDADMAEAPAELYEDSPAGFRLVYKYGRSKTSSWSLIYTSKQYIQALSHFITAMETEISYHLEGTPGKRLLTEITSNLLALLQTEEFLIAAFARTAKAHKEPPPKNLEKASKKPWAYTSGGSMAMLLQAYYKKENTITDETFWADNTTDLLSAIITHSKNIPSSHTSALISSPTHAFTLQTELPFFRKGIDIDLFPYSFVRDGVTAPAEAFYSSYTLSIQQQYFLLEELEKKGIPSLPKSSLPLSIQDFRNTLTKFIPFDLLDSFLYETLPLTPSLEWKENILKLLEGLSSPPLESYPNPVESFITAKNIKECAKALYIKHKQSPLNGFDLHAYVEETARKHRLAPPPPLLFADTNWSVYFFSFLVNPGTNELELWRQDVLGATGIQMKSWVTFMNGQDTTLWHIYNKPYEYT
jgi:hypothetical protein